MNGSRICIPTGRPLARIQPPRMTTRICIGACTTSTTALWIGTSGWIYKHWKGIFYPPELPASQHLAFYAERFSTVEVNYSFYRLPERAVFETWRNQSPQGFLFAVKGSRYLTHMKKL